MVLVLVLVSVSVLFVFVWIVIGRFGEVCVMMLVREDGVRFGVMVVKVLKFLIFGLFGRNRW